MSEDTALHSQDVDRQHEELNSTSTSVDNSNVKATQETNTVGSIADDGCSLRYTLPEDGLDLALKSVSISDGIPKVSFIASLKVCTITEEDFATVCRLVSEGKRPEFYFYGFPAGHPFAGRQYNGYHPTWLRGTSVGNLLFKADWKMKCLHVGARTDENGSSFYSWKSSSNLQGLATWPDFPKDAKPIGHSIIMSCESVKVCREDDSLEFLEDPIVTITDQSNSLYSKYISEIFPNIAYHDEKLFLKIQELSKLILACEWLIKEKGVKFSQRWMSEHTTRPKQDSSRAVKQKNSSIPSSLVSKKPPYDMIPKPTTVQRPSDDVTVMTWEAEQYRCLSKSGIKYYYGFCDGGELVLFTEDGKPFYQEKFVRCVVEQSTSLGNKKIGEVKMMVNIPSSEVCAVASSIAASDCDDPFYTLQNYTEEVMTPLGPMTLCVETDEIPTINGAQIERTTTLYPHPPLVSEPMKETMIIKTSGNNYDMLYSNFAPPNIPVGRDVSPDVETWSELYAESVPWPRSFQMPYTGVGEPAPSGGVSTRNLTEVQTSTVQRESTRMGSRSGWIDQYRRNGPRLDVQAMRGMSTGTIRLLGVHSREYSTVSHQFVNDWKKGASPSVHSIFAVTNNDLKRKWNTYKTQLGNQTVERYYHGTSLTCDITTTKTLCQYTSCGVCGISSCGLDPKFIRQNIAFQRFGSGFYLAPNSSKCHDYTEGSNGCRAMLLCDVVPGNKYRLTKTDQNIRGPPRGFNSVYGQVGQDLNYPEIVLYEPSAVLACYIILYRKDGVSHPLST